MIKQGCGPGSDLREKITNPDPTFEKKQDPNPTGKKKPDSDPSLSTPSVST